MKSLLTILLTLCIPLLTFSQSTNGKVSQGASIQLAIDSAAPGDTLFIRAGKYLENNLLIQKPLTLIGLDYPTIDADGKGEIFIVAGKDVTIQGFKLINTGRSSVEDLAAIKGLDAHDITIRDNRFDNTFFAIHLSNTNRALIQNNHLKAEAEHEYQLGNGIHLWKCKRARILDNEVSGHRDGIYFEFVTNSTIERNQSVGNMRYGLHFMFSNENEYLENTFKNNGAGVAVMYSHGMKMRHNNFEDNWGTASYGLLLKDMRDSQIIGNRFTGNTIGIYMESTSRSTFEDNLFKQNGWGVKLQASCDDNSFSKNNFIANTFDFSTNGSLVLNKVNGNYWEKYQGYDLNKDGVGDVPFHPVSMFSVIVEKVPSAMMIYRSMLVTMLDKAEKVIPAMTPENLKDNCPSMKPYDLYRKSK
ncbi:nitrous oxide reductase family maturation protein NosD [Litoribacter ruber]|uniref:nitrous oxide reductase family maturation protein NosD n=1 Tax=Litoribacter ruber TaxID=702568 RepID=UPI001BDB188A|nr:nitrous oxide reductase family maturation protein NosD [Litoribacter ruber]MBT0810350.1 nitrous oxide reductase family maturation protein NosD [Litoribacter ruber]